MWQQYLDDEWNRPSRTDYYLMKLAFHIKHIFSGGSKTFNAKDYKLPFGESKPTKPITREEKVKRDKASWIGRLGKKVRIIKKDS